MAFALTAVMQEETPLGPTDPALVALAIRDLAPPADWTYWLLVLEAAQSRTVGAVEAWLDSGQLDEADTNYLLELLEEVLERGAGTDLTTERFEELAVDAVGRTVDTDQLVGPASFVVNIVLAAPDALNAVLGEPDDQRRTSGVQHRLIQPLRRSRSSEPEPARPRVTGPHLGPLLVSGPDRRSR